MHLFFDAIDNDPVSVGMLFVSGASTGLTNLRGEFFYSSAERKNIRTSYRFAIITLFC